MELNRRYAMSDLGTERIMSDAKTMTKEDMKAFLTQVDRRLLEEELSRRAEQNEKALEDIKKRLVLNV